MSVMASSKKQSAGLLMFRRSAGGIEVLLGHPGGPFWTRKDLGAWTLPKGEIGADETPEAAARREFQEETGIAVTCAVLPLGSERQAGGKIVYGFAVEDDCDAATHTPGAL